MQKQIFSYSLLLLLLFFLTTKVNAVHRGTMVGTRKEIENVTSNKEVQELGKFSVEEYNKGIMEIPPSPLGVVAGSGSNGPLSFVEVVQAQRQVVSGLKYYLKVEAKQGGYTRTFDAVVIVKPWIQSKKLLNFGPTSRINLPRVQSERL